MSPRKQFSTASVLAIALVFWAGFVYTPKALAAPQFTIMQIQGNGVRSPLVGQSVTTTGVVYDIASNGFWMQDPNGDGDAATSDGIFVATSSTSAIHKGDSVSVTGTVSEVVAGNDQAAAPETQLTSPTVVVLSTGNPLPPPTTISAANVDPNGDLSQLERFEGMRVHVDTLNVIMPTGGALNESTATSVSDGVFYGVFPGLPRAFRGAGIELPSAAPSGSPCCIPFWNGAPQRIRVDTKALSTPQDVATGALVSNLTGPLSFAQHTYTIVTETAPAVVPPSSTSASAVPAPASDEFTIATFNLQHFYDTTNNTGTEPVLSSAAFNGRLAKLSLTIRTLLLMPDIISVQEVENLSTLQAIANRVNNDAVAAGGSNPGYAAYLIPGNDPVLNLGFLVRPRITVNSVNQYGKTVTFVQPNGATVNLNDRPPLVLDATVSNSFGSLRFLVINAHGVSTSNIDSPTDGARVRLKRRLQAEYLANLMQSFQVANPQAKILLAGDVNAYAVNDGYVDEIGTLLGTPTPANQVVAASADLVDPNFTNLEALLAPEQRYQFANFGTAESIDFLLASQGMMSSFSRFTFLRSNVDFPEIFRNTTTRPERLSTHDVPIGYFYLPGDRVPPVLTLPSGMSVEATGATGAVVNFNATASDDVDGVVPAICNPASGSTFPLGTTAVACSATDSHNNTASGTFNITVNDTTAPVLTLPGDIAANATGSSGAVVNFSASATDAVDGSVSAKCTPASGAVFPLGTTTVSCSAQDAHHNLATGQFHVTVSDTTPPVLTLPADINAEATSAAGALVTYSATAVDVVDGNVSVLCNPASGNTFAIGTTTVSCTTQDASHNTATGTFHIDVNDTTAPVLTLPADINVKATSINGANVTFTATAVDAVDGAVAIVCSPASGSTFPIATTTVSCSAHDSHNNQASGTFNVTVADTTAPVLTLPADISVSATSAAGAVVTYTAAAVDDIDGAIAVACTPASGSTFAIATTTVTCTAHDSHNNTASGSFKVTVSDSTPPVLTLPADLSIAASSAAGAVVTFTATAVDDIDGTVAVVCTPASGSTFPMGTNTVSCTAQDAHHNVVNGQFHVTVTDTAPPVLTLPADIKVSATSISGAIVNYSATASDVVDGPVAILCSPASGSNFPIGTTTVSCSAQDAHHNLANGSFHVIVSTNGIPPAVTVTGVVNGSNYTLGSVPAAGCTTTAGSVPIASNASLSITGGTSNGVGTFTATCSGAKDVLGTVAAPVSATYSVSYVWSGFFGWDSGLNQSGSTIPLKWSLMNARGAIVGNQSSIQSLDVSANFNCVGESEGAPFPAALAGGSALSFSGGTFQFNWKTTGLPAGCYNILLGLDDGTTRTALVALKSNDDPVSSATNRAGRHDGNRDKDRADQKNEHGSSFHDRDDRRSSSRDNDDDRKAKDSTPVPPPKQGKK